MINVALVMTWYGSAYSLTSWYNSITNKIPNINRIVVLEQNRGKNQQIDLLNAEYLDISRVTNFASLEHAPLLDSAPKQIDIPGTHVLITESDSIIVSPETLLAFRILLELDYLLKANINNSKESHPKFMSMKKECIRFIDFAEGLAAIKQLPTSDTGRMVYRQLKNKGFIGELLSQTRLLQSELGYLYPDLGVWDDTSMSLRAASIDRDSNKSSFGQSARQRVIDWISLSNLCVSNKIKIVILLRILFFLAILRELYTNRVNVQFF